MQAAHKKFLAKVWETRDPEIVVTTPEEAVILASIVEKETGRADERPLIASVFENRLRKNMRLQSDPTIIYGLVGGKGALDHPIQQEELDRETGYNTYKINGLPPTPIDNPGRASIEAVLRPAKTKDLYFVADGTGGHVFAASLEEHNKNVFKWRKVEREIRAKEAQEAADKAAQEAAAGGALDTGATPGAPVGAAALPREAGAPIAKTAPRGACRRSLDHFGRIGPGCADECPGSLRRAGRGRWWRSPWRGCDGGGDSEAVAQSEALGAPEADLH